MGKNESTKDWITQMNDIADAFGQTDRDVLEDMICFLSRDNKKLGNDFVTWYRENVNKSPSERV